MPKQGAVLHGARPEAQSKPQPPMPLSSGLAGSPPSQINTTVGTTNGWSCRRWVGGGRRHQGQVFGGQTTVGRKGPISIRPKFPIIQGCHLKSKPIKPSSAPSATLNKRAWIPHGSIRKEHPGDKPTPPKIQVLSSILPSQVCVGPLLNLTSKVPCSLVSVTYWVTLITPTAIQPHIP